jgi:hypothetical protein
MFFGPVTDPNAVYEALAIRFQEVLPEDRFRVSIDDAGIVKLEARNAEEQWRGGGIMFGSVELRLPLPPDMRLKMYFENRAEALQSFVSSALRHPWPSESATRHVAVDRTEIRIWFGRDNEAHAEVRLRSIPKTEINT